MIDNTRKNKNTLSEQKKHHILIIKNMYYELDGKRVNAAQAQEALNAWQILRKQPIAGGVCYELGE